MVNIRAASEEGHTSVVNRKQQSFLIKNVERTILVWVKLNINIERTTLVW